MIYIQIPIVCSNIQRVQREQENIMRRIRHFFDLTMI